MGGDLIETLKIINGIFNYGRYFFNISTPTGNLVNTDFKNLVYNQLDFFC